MKKVFIGLALLVGMLLMFSAQASAEERPIHGVTDAGYAAESGSSGWYAGLGLSADLPIDAVSLELKYMFMAREDDKIFFGTSVDLIQASNAYLNTSISEQTYIAKLFGGVNLVNGPTWMAGAGVGFLW